MASNNTNSSSSSPTEEEADGESTGQPNWLLLPRDITENIFHRLGAVEIVTSARNVCSLWWNICKDPLMWRTVNMRKSCRSQSQVLGIHTRDELREICRYIVDQSCGHLESISIENFANDEILEYIAAPASHLRRLVLEDKLANNEVSNSGLFVILEKCPVLESLHMDNFPRFDASLFGRCEDQVKDFRLLYSWDYFSDDDYFGDSDYYYTDYSDFDDDDDYYCSEV